MKRITVFILVLLVLFLLPVEGTAKTVDEILTEQQEKLQTEELPGLLPEDAVDLAEGAGISADLEGWKDLFQPAALLTLLKSLFFTVLGEEKGLLATGIVMILLLVLLKCLSDSFHNSEAVHVAENILALAGCVMLFSGFFRCIETVQTGCEQLSGFMGGLIPVFTSSMIASGQTASVSGSAILFSLCQAVSFFSSALLLPVSNLYFALGIGSGLSGNAQINALSSFFKKSIILCVGLILCVFVGGISIQKIFALSSDRLSKRMVKFAAGSFLPIAGGPISDSLEMVFSCAEILKTSVGGFGTAGVFLILVTPILRTAAYLLLTGLLSALSEALGGSVLSFFFGVTKDMFSILLTLLLCVTVAICLSLQLLCL